MCVFTLIVHFVLVKIAFFQLSTIFHHCPQKRVRNVRFKIVIERFFAYIFDNSVQTQKI